MILLYVVMQQTQVHTNVNIDLHFISVKQSEYGEYGLFEHLLF